MKNIIRNGMFETNSSSTHVCILATSNTIEDWKNGKLGYIEYLNNDIRNKLPKEAFVEDDFLKEEFFDRIPINSESSYKITLKDISDLYNNKRTVEDIWGDHYLDIIKEIKSNNYYYDEDDDLENLSKEDIICFMGSEASEIYLYDMFFKRYNDLEYNNISKTLNGTNVEVLTWDGYEG